LRFEEVEECGSSNIKIISSNPTMTSLALYKDAVSKAYYGHLGWGLNLGIQSYVGQIY
jgi:hypothetical protein